MTAISGRWKVISGTNVEAFHNAIKSPEELKDKLRHIAAERKTNPDYHLEEYFYDTSDGTIRRTVFINGEKTREIKYKIGVENDGTAPDGRPIKVKVALVGDNKIIVKEKGSGFEVEGFIEAKGNELTLSLTGNDVTSVHTYTRIA